MDLQLSKSIGYLSRLLAKETFEEIDMQMNLDTTPNKLFHRAFVIIQIDMISVLRNPKISVRYLISFVDVFLMNTNAELNTAFWLLIFERK